MSLSLSFSYVQTHEDLHVWRAAQCHRNLHMHTHKETMYQTRHSWTGWPPLQPWREHVTVTGIPLSSMNRAWKTWVRADALQWGPTVVMCAGLFQTDLRPALEMRREGKFLGDWKCNKKIEQQCGLDVETKIFQHKTESCKRLEKWGLTCYKLILSWLMGAKTC